MKTLRDIAAEQQAARVPHDDPLVERLLAEIVELGEEVCVLRDRVETAELLGERGECADKAAIDAFEPDQALIEQRLANHNRWFEDIFTRLLKPLP